MISDDGKYLIAFVDRKSNIGDLLSVKNMGIHDALADIWSNEEGWIKWGITGYSKEQINSLKKRIVDTIIKF